MTLEMFARFSSLVGSLKNVMTLKPDMYHNFDAFILYLVLVEASSKSVSNVTIPYDCAGCNLKPPTYRSND